MLRITPPAIKFIQQQIEKSTEGNCFRLSIKQTGCSGWMYVPDIVSEPKSTDIHVDSIKEFSVYLDANSQDFLKNTQIDLETKSFGFSQLVYQNPNATGECGCGESFIIEKNEHE